MAAPFWTLQIGTDYFIAICNGHATLPFTSISYASDPAINLRDYFNTTIYKAADQNTDLLPHESAAYIVVYWQKNNRSEVLTWQ